jgi:hypothetical protein
MAHALASHWSWPAPCCSLRQSKKQKSDHNQGATGSKRDQSGSGDLDQAKVEGGREKAEAGQRHRSDDNEQCTGDRR